jgi:CcmD family protein
MSRQFALIILTTALMLLQGPNAWAGNGDFMRETGKIYVVVAVLLVIFSGIVYYLIRLDKKVSSLERQIKDSSDEWKN